MIDESKYDEETIKELDSKAYETCSFEVTSV